MRITGTSYEGEGIAVLSEIMTVTKGELPNLFDLVERAPDSDREAGPCVGDDIDLAPLRESIGPSVGDDDLPPPI